MNVTPKPYVPHITPQMVSEARRCLGACNMAREKIEVFKAIGQEFPEQEELANTMAKKAEGLLATAALLYDAAGNAVPRE